MFNTPNSGLVCNGERYRSAIIDGVVGGGDCGCWDMDAVVEEDDGYLRGGYAWDWWGAFAGLGFL